MASGTSTQSRSAPGGLIRPMLATAGPVPGGPGPAVPVNFTDITGDLVMAAVAQQGLEGVVAKRLVSTYQPGRRSRAWIKTPIRHCAEVIIAGWSPSNGNANVLSALLLAVYDSEGELV